MSVGNNLLCCCGSVQQCVFCVCSAVHTHTHTHTYHPHYCVTWNTIWLWGILFLEDRMTTDKQENPCAMRGSVCSFICSLSYFSLTNSVFLQDKLAWKGHSVIVINLPVSSGCLFANQRNYMMLFNFTSHSTVTLFA